MDYSYSTNVDICYNRSKRATTSLKEKEEELPKSVETSVNFVSDHLENGVACSRLEHEQQHHLSSLNNNEMDNAEFKKFIVIRNFESAQNFKSR
jgi:hypothetical protein